MAEILALTHPAFVLRNKFGHDQFQVAYLRRLRLRWHDGPPATPLPREPDPTALTEFQLHPPHALILAWLRSLPQTSPEGIAVDIEAAGPHVRMIGISRWDEGYLPIMVRHPGGDLYWTNDQLAEIIDTLIDALASVPLWFQNGQAFDVPELLELGFPDSLVASYLRGGDTMLMQRHRYPDAPADLQFIGVSFGGMYPWKWLVREDAGDDQEAK